MQNELSLTPAQKAFLHECIIDFSLARWEISFAGQAGSQRNFLRVKERGNAGRTFVLIVWDGKDEDWPRFLAMSEELSSQAPFLPALYRSDARHGLILEEDLGDLTLCRWCRGKKDNRDAIEAAYRKVLDALCEWQSIGLEASPAIASRAMDYETFLWETDYFARRCVVDFCGRERSLSNQWELERKKLAVEAAALPKTFIHRDFQSENILLTDGKVRFVDFQGARLGPPAYDLASLLYDPYVENLGDDLVTRLFDYYRELHPLVPADPHAFDLCAAQRLMQALGAYGNLSIHKGKPRYRRFVPVALRRLMKVLERLPEYPELRAVATACGEVVNGEKGRAAPERS